MFLFRAMNAAPFGVLGYSLPPIRCRTSSWSGLRSMTRKGALITYLRFSIVPFLGFLVYQNTVLLRIQLKLNTALLSTVRPCVRASVTGVTPHISHIYKGMNAMLIIRGPIKPYIFWIKIILAIFLAKTRPDKTISTALTNLTIDFDFKLSKV